MAKKPTYEELEQKVKELQNEAFDRKRVEGALQESEQKYRQLFNHAPAGIYEVDFIKQKFINVNDVICEYTGYTREELLSMSLFDMLTEESKRVFAERSGKLFAGETVPETVEFKILGKDGREFWILLNSNFLYENGKPKGATVVVHDITDRKRAEEALRESEERFRHTFESANTGVCLVSTDGHFIKVNDRLCEFFGYNKEKLERMSVNDITHPEDLELSPDFFQQSISGEMDNIVYEKRYIHSKGHLVWGQISSSIVRDPEGEPLYFISHVQDITQQKLAEEALKKSEEKFSKIFQASPTYISLATLEEGRFVAVNDAFTKITGYQANEIIGRTFREIGLWPDPHDREEFIKQIEKYGSQHLQEATLTRKDGSFIDGLWSVEKIELEGKAHLISMLIDITEKKRAEEALRESKDNLDKAQEIAHIGNWSQNLKTDQAEWSDEMYRIHGLTPGNPKHPTHEEFLSCVHPDDREYTDSEMKKAVEKKGSFDFEFRTVPIKGSGRIIHSRGEVECDEAGVPVRRFGINQDITETRRLQAQLLESQKTEAITTLAGGIAHEFNNALMGIMGNIELFKMELPEDERTDKYFEAMKSSGHRMSRLTDQLLAYAQGGKYEPKNLKLDDFAIETLPILQHDLSPAVRVETHFSKDISYVKADHAQMQMVLSAILANSNETIENEGLIKIAAGNENFDEDFTKKYPGLSLKPGPYVCLTIEDNGKGMDEETRDRIFEPFFTTKFQGRGMGMAAVYGIIKGHNGAITVDSEPGKGTVIRIYLPAISAESREQRAKAVKQPEVELATGEGTILVIEDEEVLVGLFRQILERLGYRVLETRTGKGAVEFAKTFDGQIDLALLDIKLPDMDGGRVYPLIMEVRPNLKVIVCSGYSIDGPARAILDAGAEGFIQKPFSISPFAEKIKEVLEGK